jgi:hypothetical protein
MQEMRPKIIHALLLSGLALGIIAFVTTSEFLSWDFRNNLWEPSYLIWQGESAYNRTLLFDDANAVWFPQIIGLFFPLGLLGLYPATAIWLVGNIALLLALLWFSFRQTAGKPGSVRLGILLLAVFLFPPTIRHLILGQASVLVGAALLLGTWVAERRRLALAGFLLALALAKPQLCIVVLPCLVLYRVFKQRAWRDALKLILLIALFSAALTTPLWLASPHWVNDFIQNLQNNSGWAQPNLFSILTHRWGMAGAAVWLGLYVGVLGWNLQIWWRGDPARAVLWNLASTALVSPYAWSWDFVLLLPLLVDTALRVSSMPARLTLFAAYLACVSLTVIDALGTAVWVFPFLLLGGIVTSIEIDQGRRAWTTGVAGPLRPQRGQQGNQYKNLEDL